MIVLHAGMRGKQKDHWFKMGPKGRQSAAWWFRKWKRNGGEGQDVEHVGENGEVLCDGWDWRRTTLLLLLLLWDAMTGTKGCQCSRLNQRRERGHRDVDVRSKMGSSKSRRTKKAQMKQISTTERSQSTATFQRSLRFHLPYCANETVLCSPALASRFLVLLFSVKIHQPQQTWVKQK